MKIAPSAVRYIKLGEKDRWAKTSLERGEVQLGHSSIPHELCLAGDWEAVMAAYVKAGKTAGKCAPRCLQSPGVQKGSPFLKYHHHV